MKRCLFVTLVFIFHFFLLDSNAATTIDLVNYLGLNAEKWSIWNSGGTDKFGIVVKNGSSGKIIRKWYINKGSAWKFDSSEVWKITTDNIVLLGMNDGVDYWQTVPQVNIPRSLKIGIPYTYYGGVKNTNTGESQRLVYLIFIQNYNIDNVSTSAGKFNNCIKLRSYHYLGGDSRDSVDLMCPGRFIVKKWLNKMNYTSNILTEDQGTATRELIDYGNSAPELP